MRVPRVIIVGGGFGGLYAARALKSASVNVTLIDKRNYHLFRPMLYQVATGLLSADQISGPLRSILRHQKNTDVLMDEVTGINTDERTVQLRHRGLSYDFLVLATGIQYNYFGHDEWRSFAPGLESLDDADAIRGKILLVFERAEAMASVGRSGDEAVQRELTFALVGAGTVGVMSSINVSVAFDNWASVWERLNTAFAAQATMWCLRAHIRSSNTRQILPPDLKMLPLVVSFSLGAYRHRCRSPDIAAACG